jgi:pyrimidine-specific ribonucleoside hydrolase
MKVLATLLLLSTTALASPRTLIVDTDVGTDDLMALAFLLSRSDVNIEAITVVSGVAHVHAGAINVLKLLDVAGKRVPVYEGAEQTPQGGNDFPDQWRMLADNLPSVELPRTDRKPEAQSAADYLAARLHEMTKPVTILALGPLTNIAAALTKFPQGIHCVEDMVIMGGAVRVRGNLTEGGSAYVNNQLTEWNFFADPYAVKKVFDSGVRFRLVPLDATNSVPITMEYANQFKKRAKTPLGKITADILASSHTLIDAKIFFAWDPLAAVAVVNPEVVKISSVALSVHVDGNEAGRTQENPGIAGNARVALSADAALFDKVFLAAF